MTFTLEQIKLLQSPLDPANVKPPPRGKYGEYVDGYHVICEANRIFGHGEWSYEITMMEQCSSRMAQDSKGGEQVRIGYRCTVRATVCGATREGGAVGTGMAKPENEADAHESAIKEAETDALKRALRSFGYTFGLALYDKAQTNVQQPAPAKITQAQADELILLMTASGFPKQRFLETGGIAKTTDMLATDFEKAKGWLKTEINKMGNKNA
tara:strand:- start:396 stop:1031 length:636 start_codon:yes stop_codon:yes gene_type:complete